MRFSIIIPTGNPPEECFQLVVSLGDSLHREELAEVVIVVNGVSAQKIHSKTLPEVFHNPKVRIIGESVGSLLAGRHRGVAETTGEVVSFLDDDVVVNSGWFDALVQAFASYPDLVIAGGPSRPRFLATPPRWLKELNEEGVPGGHISPFMSLIDLGNQEIVPVDPNLIWGLNLSVRRDVLQQLGGFHPDLLPASEQMFQGDGETGLTRKIAEKGLLAGYFPGLAVTHTIPVERMTLDYVKRRAFYEGVGEAYTKLRESERDSNGRLDRSLQRMIRSVLSRAIRFVRTRIPDSWLRPRIHALVTKHRLRGQEYLREHYRRNPRVREWVGRDDYWDWAHPSAKK